MAQAVHLPAAELLLKQFVRAADEVIQKTPQESLPSLLADPRFARCLAGLKLLVSAHLPLLLRQLEGWRTAVAQALQRAPDRSDRERAALFSKRAAMEVVYFEAALQVLEEYDHEWLDVQEFVSYYDELHKVAFRLLLIAEENFPPDLAAVYKVVVMATARVLGAVSRKISLEHVVKPFFTALAERINPRKDGGAKPNYDLLRAQIMRLCGGMRQLCLSFSSEDAVREATAFLRRANPLTPPNTAPIKKSQIHHTLADTLTAVLLPLVRSDAPQRAVVALGPPAMEQWYGTVASMRSEIYAWANKHPKHFNEGYPLATALVCLLADRDYSATIDTTADLMHKGLKVKEHRAVCVRCLVVLACSYLVRYGAHIIRHELHKFLDKLLKPVTALAKKGGLSVGEQMDVIAPIAELSPEYAVQSLVLELLTCDAPEAIMAGLRALAALVAAAPAQAAAAAGGPAAAAVAAALSSASSLGGFGASSTLGGASSSSSNLPGSSSSSALQALLRRTQTPSLGGTLASGGASTGGAGNGGPGPGGPGGLGSAAELLRRGLHPLELLGVAHLLPRINAALAKLLATWHPQYGTYVQYGPVDPNWKEKAGGLPLLVAFVSLVPYIKPETWQSIRPLELLPGYTAHVEAPLRSAAQEALRAVVRGSPALRNAALAAVAGYAMYLPDDAVQAQREAQVLLRQLMEQWGSALAERAAGDAVEAVAGGGEAASAARTLDVARLEGCCLVWLASHDEGVRREAVALMHLIRKLHGVLLLADPYEPPVEPPARLPSGRGGAHHGPSGSRDSIELGETAGRSHGVLASLGLPARTSTPGLVDPSLPSPEGGQGAAVHPYPYLADLLEQAGPGLVRAVYWDFGDLSDLWRRYKAVPEGITFEDVLIASPPSGSRHSPTAEDVPRVRLARALLELTALAARLAPASAGVAGAELLYRLGRMVGRGPDGRPAVLADYVETPKRDAWRNCAAAVCAVPSSLRERVAERLGRRASTALGVRDIIRLHLQLLAPGGVAAANTQICSMLSLGHLSPDLYGVLLEEMQPYAEEIARGGGSKSKGKGRADELRRVVAHVFRILAERQTVDTLTAYPALRSRLLDFVRDSAAQLRPVGLSAEAFWDGWQVAYCLASVVRSIAVPLRPLLSQPLGGPGAGGSAGSLGRDSQGRPVGGGGAEAGVPLRKALWELLLVWSEEAYVLLKNVKALVASLGPGEDAAAALRSARESNYERAVALGISAAMARYKEPPEGMKEELRSAAAAINHASRLALAALVEGPAFDSDTRWPQGPVFTWVDKLLAVANEGAQRVVVGPGDVVGPLRREVGLRALRGLLTHNPDLFDAALNKAYDDNPSLANGYFQVLVEVYALRPVRCPAHVALGLILVKLVDAAAEVREDALHMLAVLSAREWAAPGAEPPPLPVPAPAEHSGSRGTHQPPSARASRASLTVTPADGAEALGGPLEDEEAVVVVGSLQDSYTQFQYQLSCRLARDHPELSEALAEELLTRQLQCEDGAIAHPVLTSLAPWLENLVIGFPWRGNWSERLLKSMYYVTLRHGRSLPYEVERLWTMLARRTRNINPILDFLLHLGNDTALQTDLTALLEFFGACKRIVLFLARVSPAETMGYLAVELARQQQEEDGAPAVGTAGLEHTEPRTSRAHAQAHPQPPPAVLVLGGCLDSVVSGGEPVRTLYGSYESTTSASASASMLSVGGVMVGADGASTAPTRALSARSDASGGSRSEANGGLRPSEDAGPSGGGPSPALSRAQSAAGAGGRALLSRPELVLCCLAEVVLEQPVDPQHLHLLLHVATTAADHGEPVVAAHCQQLLTNLLYSLSARHIESGADGSASAPATPSNGPMASSAPGSGDAATSSLPAATRLIRYLQSLRGRPLWPRDEFSLAGPAAVAAAAAPDGHLTPGGAALASLTVAIADALSYEPDLMSDWAARALEWATTARGRHAACRSWQVLRALRPPLKADLAAAVVVALEAAFAAGSMEGVEVAVEVIATARVLVAALPPGRLVLAPQLWWSALALLHSPHVAVYRAALGLLAGCLGAGPDAGAGEGCGLRLGSAKVQAVLLAAAPGLSAGQLLAASAAAAAQGADGAEDADPWVLGAHVLHVREGGASSSYISIAVQQLLLRGLTHPLTVVPTLRLMGTLADTLTQQAGSLEARAASAGSGPGLGDTQNGGGMRGGAAPSGQDSLYNTGQGGVAPGITTGSGGAGGSGVPYGDSLRKHTALKLDSYIALLGSCRGQLFVSVAGILPLLLALHGGAGTSAADDAASMASSQHRASGGFAATIAAAAAAARSGAHLAGWAGTGGAGGPAAADPELTAALAAAVAALGRAAAALGMPDVGAHLATLSSSQVAHDPALLDAALTALLGQMAAQLLPRYARTLLAHIADLISAGSGPGPAAAPPAAPRQVRAALLMLRCLFQVEGLRLGPAAAVAVADGPLLAPVVALTAGPLGPAAVEALAAVMRHCRGSTFQRELAAAAGQGSAHGGPRTLFPPPTPVVAALKPVVETLGTGLRRRGKATRLMPFLGTAAD